MKNFNYKKAADISSVLIIVFFLLVLVCVFIPIHPIIQGIIFGLGFMTCGFENYCSYKMDKKMSSLIFSILDVILAISFIIRAFFL